MSVTGVGGVSPVPPISPAGAVDALRAGAPSAQPVAGPVAADDPAGFFDVTGWRGPQAPTVSVGPAQAGTPDLAALSRGVLAALTG